LANTRRTYARAAHEFFDWLAAHGRAISSGAARLRCTIAPIIYGYAWVSTDGQSVDAQVKQLRDAGAEKVFRETGSRAKSDRVQLRRALDQLGKGDVLMVTIANTIRSAALLVSIPSMID
jgi:hypothetical protein